MVKWLRYWFAPPTGLQLVPDAPPAPWAPGRTALYARIIGCKLMPDGSLPDPAFKLPDQLPPPGGQCEPGERDGDDAPAAGARDPAQAQALAAALSAAAADQTVAKLTQLYDTLLSAAPHSVDACLDRLASSRTDPKQAANLARWLACKAPDIMAVRCGVALLGQYGDANDVDLIMTVGRHETFTVTCAIALCKLLGPEQAQTAMWNLARRVHGWGRIHMVHRLSTTGCPEIQQWLLRDGYKNTREDTALAYLCATGGKLLPALQSTPTDERLLIGAGDILRALLAERDGRARTMHDYGDGAPATLAYLDAVRRQRPRQLRVAAAVLALSGVERHALPWDQAAVRGVTLLAREILQFDQWPALVRASLDGADEEASRLATALAPAFGVTLHGKPAAPRRQGAAGGP